ncbi:cilia- and flagella-associated protein 251 [Scleropages formosus]|uniref:cilia- and flagella-associated protein 251 n=1 Tax=Scleropages formosus TaxID=113540 RepID=UPI0008790C60|nr:cilia- and flagella-associated protein 251 [Scleropages formosus]XP_018608320.1 cilia- and flagella-associated protein 251 [Scleropages formosus]
MSGVSGTQSPSSLVDSKEEASPPKSGEQNEKADSLTQSDMESGEEEPKKEHEDGQESHLDLGVQGQPRDSQVYTATSRTLFSLEQSRSPSAKTHPLNLEWAFGINKSLPVFNLHHDEQLVVLYGCAHVAVVYNHTSNSQYRFQGHCSLISSLCMSEDKRWLVTADKGSESLVIIWDTYSGIPVRTIFDCHPEGGVAAIALSRDSKLLVSVGAGPIQRVCVWDWTSDTENPLCVTDLSLELGRQHHILFHPNDSSQLLSNSDTHVLFYTMEMEHLHYSVPEISDKTFSKVVGSVSQSIFCLQGSQAISATMAGNLLLWDVAHTTTTHQPHREVIKLIPLQDDGITVLTLNQSFIVTGDIRGHVKFYDNKFKLMTWFSEFNLDPITSISFSKETDIAMLEYGENCSLEAKQFVVQNFVVSTATAMVVYVDAQDGVLQMLVQGDSEAVHAVVCHPLQPFVAFGSHCGVLNIWDYQQKKPNCRKSFPEEKIQCLAYDPQGLYLAVGFASGAVKVMEVLTLEDEDVEYLKYSKNGITHITFSMDSRFLATADAGNAVMVFQLAYEDSRKVWNLLGRYCSHYKPIQDLLFGVCMDTTQPKLLSLGLDRILMEYGFESSSQGELTIRSTEQIEQSAVPTCMAWYPALTTESFLLIASDQYKMKLFNSTDKMCRKTVLGPIYGSPIKKIAILPKSAEGNLDSRYLAFITTDKVGLEILPLDGNPYKSFAIICHPAGVSAFACSCDGKYIFTIGGPDYTIFSWEANLNALEAAASLGGQGLIPFYSLLEGGRDGEFFKEMEDYFYYCQLRSEGINSMKKRRVSTKIPLKEVPFIMRALGFYPTEQELMEIQNEVKFSRYAETGKYVTDIDLEDFIKLFVNHRPAFGISRKEIQHIFEVLGDPNENGEQSVNREELLELLQTIGENMTEEELTECFTTLLGRNPEGGRSELESTEHTAPVALLESEFPTNITMDILTVDILGFPETITEASFSELEGSPAGSQCS